GGGGELALFTSWQPKLVLEVDGPAHAVVGSAIKGRDRWFQTHGYPALRFPADEVFWRCEVIHSSLNQSPPPALRAATSPPSGEETRASMSRPLEDAPEAVVGPALLQKLLACRDGYPVEVLGQPAEYRTRETFEHRNLHQRRHLRVGRERPPRGRLAAIGRGQEDGYLEAPAEA